MLVISENLRTTTHFWHSLDWSLLFPDFHLCLFLFLDLLPLSSEPLFYFCFSSALCIWPIWGEGREELYTKLTNNCNIWSELNNTVPLGLHGHSINNKFPCPPANTTLHLSSTYGLSWHMICFSFTFRSADNQHILTVSPVPLDDWERQIWKTKLSFHLAMSHIQTDGLATLSGVHYWSNSNGKKCRFTENEPVA